MRTSALKYLQGHLSSLRLVQKKKEVIEAYPEQVEGLKNPSPLSYFRSRYECLKNEK